MKCLITLLMAFSLYAADAPRIFYSKSFPRSSPEYFQVTVDKAGNVEYGEAPDDDNPLKFKLNETETTEIFGLADKLEHFKHPLDLGKSKIAFMGSKLFRYEDGSGKSEVKFNYTEDVNARALTDWFERMGESARYRIELERAVKYDKLGVFKALSQINSAWSEKRIVGPEQYLPMLDRVIKGESYMHTARTLASELAESFRNSK